MYHTNVRNHLQNVKILIKDLSASVNIVTNGNMVLVWVGKSQTNTLTLLCK